MSRPRAFPPRDHERVEIGQPVESGDQSLEVDAGVLVDEDVAESRETAGPRRQAGRQHAARDEARRDLAILVDDLPIFGCQDVSPHIEKSFREQLETPLDRPSQAPVPLESVDGHGQPGATLSGRLVDPAELPPDDLGLDRHEAPARTRR